MTIDAYSPRPTPPRSTRRSTRPKDAATLILLRKGSRGPQVLMGQRHGRHRFMPDLFVFPGGRLSPADYRIVPPRPMKQAVETQLLKYTARTNASAFALAAIRETFEETGLKVGEPVERVPKTRSAEWQAYFAQGIVPRVDRLDFVARAITPPSRNRRFDARFFLGNTSMVHGDLDDFSQASGELENLAWIDLEEALSLPIADITEAVLTLLRDRVSKANHDTRPVFVRYKNGLMRPERL